MRSSRPSPPPGEDVVELGCGPNPVVLIELARRGKRVSAHELSEDFCRTAMLNAERNGVSLTVTCGPAHETPFETGRFDVVVLTEVLEHVPDSLERAVLREVLRILRPGGRFMISVPNERSLYARYLVLRNGSKQPNPEHLREYTPAILRHLLEEVGFEVERPVRVRHTLEPFRATKTAYLIDHLLPRAAWSLKAAFVARKPS